VTSSPAHRHPHADPINTEFVEKEIAIRIRRIAAFLEAHFGDVRAVGGDISTDEPGLIVRLDESEARVNLVNMVSNYKLLSFVLNTDSDE
jgi:hypothetical protein